jgi:hypothetical protein
MENNAINIGDFDAGDFDRDIYRIFSLGRFKELIENNELVLVRPSIWDDPFENFFLKGNTIDGDGNLVSLEHLYNSWYGQCWTLTPESDALWRIYSPDKQGVRIRTNMRKLFSVYWDDQDIHSRNKYYIGVVNYYSRKEIEKLLRELTFVDAAIGGRNIVFAELLCLKRLEFQHESEVRILYNDIHGFEEDGLYRRTIDYNQLFEEVCLDPRLELTEFNLIRDELIKLGCKLPIIQSNLYRVDFAPIRMM